MKQALAEDDPVDTPGWPALKLGARRGSFLAPLLTVLLMPALPGPVAAEFANPTGVAVIIGNANYEHRDVPRVDFAHRDAEAFRRYVVDVLGYDPANVIDRRDASRRELHDVFGTRTNPEGLLWSYLDPAGGSDVVVFYSGHGVPGTDDGRGYLLPVDADPNAAADDGYPIDLLYRNVGGLVEARSVRVYLDACFSGGSHAGRSLIRNASPVYVTATLSEEVAGKVTALAAASGEQVASWDEAAGHGLFTHHLLDALYGGGDADGDGRVTAAEAKAHLDRHMTRAARRQHRRIQEASLVGEADAVLASAERDGMFPARPDLDGLGATAGAATEAAAEQSASRAPVTEMAPPQEATAERVEAALGLTHAERVRVQHGLESLGFEVGLADGVFGSRTRAGLGFYQRQKGLPETGYLTAEMRDALMAMGEARQAEAQREKEEAAREAERRADDEAFARARRTHTPAGYLAYLDRGGRHVAEAEAQLVELSKPRLPAGAVFRDCETCPEMVVVPAGSFRMGSPKHEFFSDDERPVHGVTIPARFAVGKHEVTRGEFRRFMDATGYTMSDVCWLILDGRWNEGAHWLRPGFSQTDRHPVVCVGWEDTQAYVGWLSRETGEQYRLLSESEWEYAVRAGSQTRYAWGDDLGRNRANCDGCGSHWDGETTAPVGSFAPNAFGLHDLHGNAGEWVEDCWNDSYAGAPSDGTAWTRGDCRYHVRRGGSFDGIPMWLRSAFRVGNPSGLRYYNLGFRVARTLTP